MNLKFFSLKTAATSATTIVQLFLNQIAAVIEVNGAGKEMLIYLSHMHRDDILEMQKKIDEILINERPLKGLNPKAINERASTRCLAMADVFNRYMGKNLTGRLKPKLTQQEYEAIIFHFENFKNQAVTAIKNLRTENSSLKTSLTEIEKMKNPGQGEKKSKISIGDIVKEYKRVSHALRTHHNQLAKKSTELEEFQRKIARLEQQIETIDQQINQIALENNELEQQKIGLEAAPETDHRNQKIAAIIKKFNINIKRLEKLETDHREKEKLMLEQREKEKFFKEEIATLELEIIRNQADDVFLPFFAFLKKYFVLSPAIQYQLAKKLISDSKNQKSRQLWQNNLYPLLAELEQSQNPVTVMSDWLKKNISTLDYQIDRHGHLKHFSLVKDEMPEVALEYFKNINHQAFSLNPNIALYLLPSFLELETKDIEKTLLLPEINQRVTEPETFWRECWQIGYHQADLKIKFQKLKELWNKYQLKETQVVLWGEEKLTLINPAPTPKKILDALTHQNILKKNLNKDSVILLMQNYHRFKQGHAILKDKNPRLPVYIGFSVQTAVLAPFSFYFLNSALYMATDFIPGINMVTLTVFASTPVFLTLSYWLAKWFGLFHLTVRQIVKNLFSWKRNHKNEQLLTETLKLSSKTFADFELELWQEFLKNYPEGAALTKKIAHDWLSEPKKKMRLTNKMENNELDRRVENVVLGEMRFDKNKIFSQSDFDQIRKLLVSELIDRYLKQTLTEQAQKIWGFFLKRKLKEINLKKI